MYSISLVYYLVTSTKGMRLTVNSPVLGSKPTCTVCSKSIGEEISGLSFPEEREGGREGRREGSREGGRKREEEERVRGREGE